MPTARRAGALIYGLSGRQAQTMPSRRQPTSPASSPEAGDITPVPFASGTGEAVSAGPLYARPLRPG